MEKLVKPTMDTAKESRLQRLIGDTKTVSRLKYRETLKSERHNQLVKPKTSPLPIILPSNVCEKDSKCWRCDVDKFEFTKTDDWCLEAIDALEIEIPSKKWFHWMTSSFFSIHAILSNSMSSLVIHPAHIKMLHNIREKKPEVPIVFVLKSENVVLDLLMLNYIFYVNKLEFPSTVVDKKLQNIPTVGDVLQHFNLTFIDDGDKVNEAKLTKQRLQEHKTLLLTMDNEGNELKEVLNVCDFGLSMEIFMLPVTISSEKQRCQLTSFSHLKENLGIVKVNFHEPYMIKDFIQTNEYDDEQNKLNNDVKFLRIIKHLSYDIDMKRPIMSTNFVAFLLLTWYRDGATKRDLSEKLDEIRESHRSLDFAFEGDSEEIVEHAIDMLGRRLVLHQNGFFRPPIGMIDNIVELSSYAQVLTPFFLFKSVVVTSALTLKSKGRIIDYEDVINLSQFKCNILSIEYPIVKPCENIPHKIRDAFEGCVSDGLLIMPEEKTKTENEMRALRIAKNLFDDSDDESSEDRTPCNEVKINEELREEIQAMKKVVMPFLEMFFTVVCILEKIPEDSQEDENKFIERALRAMREECFDLNHCKTLESCSIKWVRSSLKYLEETNVIIVNRSEAGNFISIHPEYRQKKFQNFLNDIERIFEAY
ncbi:CLUMA_CG009539, isoform A [Clunio marinus]|uniref:CLUMA_CG009539, isoform A n=1 Tax=Clunio marinus TaxID=568069 RepID=A0A1J1I718_9DIPT|nr:CLUMA_CG009539, isoform A [Clunio marinus]